MSIFMAVDIETVSRIAREYAADVSRELPVEKAVLFGSYAKATAPAKAMSIFVFSFKVITESVKLI
jgi:predicted nucleotidyltransferase